MALWPFFFLGLFHFLKESSWFFSLLSTVFHRWFAGEKWGKREREMVPRELINSTQIQPCSKGLILSLIWGSFNIVMEGNARAHTHTHIKWNPLFGETSYRKLTYAQELANLFCHIWIVPAASVTTHTKTQPSWVGFYTSPTLKILALPMWNSYILGEEEKIDPRRKS